MNETLGIFVNPGSKQDQEARLKFGKNCEDNFILQE